MIVGFAHICMLVSGVRIKFVTALMVLSFIKGTHLLGASIMDKAHRDMFPEMYN